MENEILVMMMSEQNMALMADVLNAVLTISTKSEMLIHKVIALLYQVG